MRTLLLIGVMLLPLSLSAKPFYKTKSWWIAEAGSTALVAADAWSTNVGLQRCPGCGDNFPFFPVHSNGGLAGAAAINLAFSTAFHILEHHITADSNSKWYRYAGDYSQLGIDGAIHGWAINHNLNFECHQAGIHC